MILGTLLSLAAAPPAPPRPLRRPAKGAKTLLIEQTGAMGGSGTSALVPVPGVPFPTRKRSSTAASPKKSSKNPRSRYRPHQERRPRLGRRSMPRKLKRIYDKMVSDAGATVLFHTLPLLRRNREGNAVSALIVSNKRASPLCAPRDLRRLQRRRRSFRLGRRRVSQG